MTTFRHFTLALASGACLTLAACGAEADGDGTIETAAEEDNSLAAAIGADSTLGSAIEAAGLADVLSGPVPYTVLAPSDEAFDALPAGALDALLAEDAKEQLGQVLTYHILPGTILADDIASAIEAGGGSTQLPTLGGATLTARLEGDEVVLVDAAGSQARILASEEALDNGALHRLDRVLMPN